MEMRPFFENESGKIYQGECLRILAEMEDGSVDAVITDPPYSSGGLTKNDRAQKTSKKYQQGGTEKKYPEFVGDTRDGHSWLAWCSLWIGECWRILKDGGAFVMFTDWRQYPSASDALQAGGITWRGVVTWDKTTAARPSIMGYPRHQCEYVLWGTKGDARPGEGVLPGCLSVRVNPSEKYHLTGKPLELMTSLLQIAPAGGLVLDPFMGGGTTCAAAMMTGRKFIGIEYSAEYCEITRQRLAGYLPMNLAEAAE